MVAVTRIPQPAALPSTPRVQQSDGAETRSSGGVGDVPTGFDVDAALAAALPTNFNADAALAAVLASGIGPNVTGPPDSSLAPATFRIPSGVTGLVSTSSSARAVTSVTSTAASSEDFAARLKAATGLTVEEFNAVEMGSHLGSLSFLHDRVKEVKGLLNADGTWNTKADGFSSKYAFAKMASMIPGEPTAEKMALVASLLGPDVGYTDPVTGQFDLLGAKGGDGLVTVGKGPSGKTEFVWTYYEEGDAHVGHPNGYPGDDVRMSILNGAYLEAYHELPDLEAKGYWMGKMRYHAPVEGSDNRIDPDKLSYWRERILGMDAGPQDLPPFGKYGRTTALTAN